MSLKKNLFHNVFGVIFPIFLALLSTPYLIKGLGLAQYGLLTIAWIFMGYFSFLDFGISRALTNIVAKNRDSENLSYAWSCIWSAIFILSVLSCSICGIVHLNIDLVSDHFSKSDISHDNIVNTLICINLSVPIVIVTGLQKGVLEGFERFDLINKIRTPMSLWSYSAPVILLPFTKSVLHVVIFLIIGRLITLFFYFLAIKRFYTPSKKISKKAISELLHTGGWIGFSSIMSPLMIYIDRFVIASKVSLNSVAYYTTPMDAITKLLQPVDAISGVFFPALSRAALNDKEKFQKLYVQSFELLSILMFSGSLFLIIFGAQCLSIWLGSDFANKSYLILQVLAVGVFSNAVARSPWGAIQASGQALFTGIFQLAQLLPYFFILYWFANIYGILGVAIAWSIRVTFDLLGLVLKTKNSHILKLTMIYLSLLILALLISYKSLANPIIISFVFLILFLMVISLFHKQIDFRAVIKLSYNLRGVKNEI